jgi:hypothetical protein
VENSKEKLLNASSISDFADLPLVFMVCMCKFNANITITFDAFDYQSSVENWVRWLVILL